MLYDKISQLSWASSELRRSSNVLFDLESISRHTTTILEKVAKNYDTSVDLRSLAAPAQPYPTNFKTHVLNILERLEERLPKDPRTQHPAINSEVIMIKKTLKYFANCIAGEVLRSPCMYSTQEYLRTVHANANKQDSGKWVETGAAAPIYYEMERNP